MHSGIRYPLQRFQEDCRISVWSRWMSLQRPGSVSCRESELCVCRRRYRTTTPSDSLGAVDSSILVFPLHFSNDPSAAPAVTIGAPLPFSTPGSILFDLAWGNDSTLFVLERSISTHGTSVRKLAVLSAIMDTFDGLDFSSDPSFSCNRVVACSRGA